MPVMKWNSLTRSSKLRILIIIGIIIVALAVGYYWIESRHSVSTDDAYVNANVIGISSEVSGPILYLYVRNDQQVNKNDPLFDIDPRPYELAVAKAQADLGLVQKTAADKTDAIAAAQTVLQQAQLNLQNTRVIAPATGVIANMSIRPGNIVQTGETLFDIISTEAYWIDANFKETDLERIHKGQSATIKLDMYPDHVFQGVVDSISGSTGTVFSLFPPENATGNWVKVTQRVPVRVKVLNPDPRFPLRIGTTAQVTIRTD